MHQTTIRFSPEVWARLESEARAGGVSAAQYVREAIVERLAYTAAQRGPVAADALPQPDSAELPSAAGEPRTAAARAASVTARSGAEAVWAQARLALARAQEMLEAADVVQSAVHAQRRS